MRASISYGDIGPLYRYRISPMTTPKSRLYLSIFIQTLVIAVTAWMLSTLARNIYLFMIDSPPVNWGITGRWVAMVAQGKFYTPSMSQEPSVMHEELIGLALNWTTTYLFAVGYFILIKYILNIPFRLGNGLLCGLILIIFPFFVQFPSMGIGVVGLDAPNPWEVFGRAVVTHISFGLGMGAGGILSSHIVRRLCWNA